jgi:hypothetical protein
MPTTLGNTGRAFLRVSSLQGIEILGLGRTGYTGEKRNGNQGSDEAWESSFLNQSFLIYRIRAICCQRVFRQGVQPNPQKTGGPTIMYNPKRHRSPTMESHTHTIANLFAQLGLPCDTGRHRQPSSSTHAPLPSRPAAGRTHRSGRLSQAAVSESRYFDEDS